jgi:hypothetical protein
MRDQGVRIRTGAEGLERSSGAGWMACGTHEKNACPRLASRFWFDSLLLLDVALL